MTANKMRFGAFIAPFHPLDENVTLCLERDLDLVVLMDKLGYHEAWIGEHHSGGYETISSPELFIATVAERTKNIRLGTGVSSLPYHHPLTLAGRITQIDQITRGRVMVGVGPGALPMDAYMMGIPIAKQRDRMDESLDILIRLLRGEVVNHKSEWLELVDARVQVPAYSDIEFAVASQTSPTGATAAGRNGVGLLSVGATTAGGFNALASNWAICEDIAKDNNKTVDRKNWRVVGPMHIAQTREEAKAQVRYGLEKWQYYFSNIAALPLAPAGTDPVEAMIASGMGVIGTPDDAIAQIQRLTDASGGFGTYLVLDNNWAEWEHKKKSYEMIARHVFPKFTGVDRAREASLNWTATERPKFMPQSMAAVGARVAQHIEKKGAKNIAPEIAAAMGITKKD